MPALTVPSAPPRAARHTPLWMVRVALGMLMALLSLGYVAATFTGLESQSGYQGNVYKALHPESFPNDPYMHGLRPTQLSLFYVLARLVGEPWLDDRLLVVIAWAIALVSLLALDNTVRLFGATRISERVALWSLMLLEHRVLENHARLIDTADVNPTMLASPVALWLLYHSFASSRAWTIIALSVLLVLISMKVAAMPVLIAGVLLCKERLGPAGRRLAAAGAVVAVGAGLWWYDTMLRPADGSDVELFRWIVRIDGPEGHPFLNPAISNMLFVGMCLAGFGLQGLPQPILSRIKVMAGLGLLVWLVGGLYLSFAPDFLKIPSLVPFGVVRSLWWTQYVLYVAFGVVLLKWIQRAPTWRGLGTAWALLIALDLLHASFRDKLAVVIVVMTVALCGWLVARSRHAGRAQTWRQGVTASARRQVVAASLCLGTLSLYGVGTLHHRWEDFTYLVRDGVMGDNPSAKWHGIDEYLRTHTPASATVLAFSLQDHRWSPPGLRCDGWLRTRAGRPMPVGPRYSFVLDYHGMRWHEARVRQANTLVERWKQRDASGVMAGLASLDSPDYLVVPNEEASWVRDVPEWPYHTVTVIRDFTIMRWGGK